MLPLASFVSEVLTDKCKVNYKESRIDVKLRKANTLEWNEVGERELRSDELLWRVLYRP